VEQMNEFFFGEGGACRRSMWLQSKNSRGVDHGREPWASPKGIYSVYT